MRSNPAATTYRGHPSKYLTPTSRIRAFLSFTLHHSLLVVAIFLLHPGLEPETSCFEQTSEIANYQLSYRRVYSSVGSWLFHLFVQNKRFRVRVPDGARKWQLQVVSGGA